MGSKTCSRCGIEKPLDLFYRAKRNVDGLQSHCKLCDNKRATLRLRAKAQREVALGTRQERTQTLVSRELHAQGLKRCPGCKAVKQLECFYDSKGAAHGKASYCVACIGASKLSVVRTPISDQQRLANREKVLRREFGITMDQYQAMHKAQGGLCAICKQPENGKSLAVDHNHASGKVRELLCGRCNPAVGFLRECPELARELAAYLEKHR